MRFGIKPLLYNQATDLPAGGGGAAPAGGQPAVPPAQPAPPAPPRREPTEEETRAAELRASDLRLRERRKILRDEYGTDDEDEIDRIRRQRKDEAAARATKDQELERLRKDKEERDRANMSEVERLQADLKVRDDEIKVLKDRLAKVQQEALSDRQTAAITAAAMRHRVKNRASVLRVATQDFATYYLGLPKGEQAKFDSKVNADRYLDRFMKGWAKDNPDMCEPEPQAPADPAASKPAQAARAPAAPVRRPVGAPPAKQPAGGRTVPQNGSDPTVDPVTGKTTRPGRPNSMTSAEVEAFKRKQLGQRRAG